MQSKAAILPSVEKDDFAASVAAGLTAPCKSIPCRFFYDERGSILFEEITKQPEYYLTDAEISILEAQGREMVDRSQGAALVEFGSGSSRKTEILIQNAPALFCYVPIDVSQSALSDAALRLRQKFPNLKIFPLLRDFTDRIDFPQGFGERTKIGFFPGSTIGNFAPYEAVQLLRSMQRSLSPGGQLLVGVDLKKDVRLLLRAYNDAKGVTAEFNLNLLERINREVGANFELHGFRHEAIYNSSEGRIEMRLISMKNQTVYLLDHLIHFDAGESIHTENSYKYSIDEFRRLTRSAGWAPSRTWTDSRNLFALHELISMNAC
jgi:dimethylhistidine N-methyltransferase